MPEQPHTPSGARTLRVCALYPDLMNIYADRGNLLVLERRCAWRGIGFRARRERPRRGARRRRARPLLSRRRPGPRPAAVRAGPARDTSARGCTRRRRAARSCSGSAVAISCSATPTRSIASEIPGVGLLDVRTVREDGPRLIGNVAIEVDLDGGERRHRRGRGRRVLAGFENHGGRTRLGDGQQPLGRVLKGHGNDGRSGIEGVRSGEHDRHLPARAAAAEERLVRRLADRARARHRRARARASARRARAMRPTAALCAPPAC